MRFAVDSASLEVERLGLISIQGFPERVCRLRYVASRRRRVRDRLAFRFRRCSVETAPLDVHSRINRCEFLCIDKVRTRSPVKLVNTR
jgi:hypothetical protein